MPTFLALTGWQCLACRAVEAFVLLLVRDVHWPEAGAWLVRAVTVEARSTCKDVAPHTCRGPSGRSGLLVWTYTSPSARSGLLLKRADDPLHVSEGGLIVWLNLENEPLETRCIQNYQNHKLFSLA